MSGWVTVTCECMKIGICESLSLEVLSAITWLCACKRRQWVRSGDSGPVMIYMLGCADMLVVPFLGFLWCLIHGPRRKKAFPQGSWERHWATFPTFGPGLGTLKGTGTHTPWLHLSLPLPSVALSVPPRLPLLKRKNPTWAEGVYIFFFFSHEWLMAGEMPAGSDRNLWWTVKHVFVYCFAYGLHKQSYSRLCV